MKLFESVCLAQLPVLSDQQKSNVEVRSRGVVVCLSTFLCKPLACCSFLVS